MGFTESLKKLRLEKGLTQDQLAKMVGISNAAIGYYELNIKQPSVTVAGAIAEKLGTTVDAMIKGDV